MRDVLPRSRYCLQLPTDQNHNAANEDDVALSEMSSEEYFPERVILGNGMLFLPSPKQLSFVDDTQCLSRSIYNDHETIPEMHSMV
ncbi:hypothetical protein NPIL_669241 [Nephila pilipes]|uniref:Uncharacterized protein n=1 Tax=Nephila pilipes TaxID=299642 RepID=A0A8X6Q5H3_NEPPI|nr:hypothetical protein NPIL_669241 [Nephila pilipes]